MRKIKFRAWHKKQSKMIYDVQKTEMVHHSMSSMAGEPSGLDHYFDEEWYELMQYTGLKDKNDQEIYEGDLIISDHWRSNEHMVIQWDDILCKFYASLRDGGDSIDLSEAKKLVVGNIFEGVDK